MKKTFRIAFLTLLMIVSCTKYNKIEFCSCSDPLHELEWLNEKYKDFRLSPNSFKIVISCAIYDGQEGFFISKNVGGADSYSTFYDCEGNAICTIGLGPFFDCPDFEAKITYKEILWSNQ